MGRLPLPDSPQSLGRLVDKVQTGQCKWCALTDSCSSLHIVFISILFIVFGYFVYLCWIYKMPSSSSVKYSLELSLMIFERLYLHYFAIIIVLVENGLKT